MTTWALSRRHVVLVRCGFASIHFACLFLPIALCFMQFRLSPLDRHGAACLFLHSAIAVVGAIASASAEFFDDVGTQALAKKSPIRAT